MIPKFFFMERTDKIYKVLKVVNVAFSLIKRKQVKELEDEAGYNYEFSFKMSVRKLWPQAAHLFTGFIHL